MVKEADRLWRWDQLARANQRYPEGDYTGWLIKSGRAWGKTFAGAGNTIKRAMETRGGHLALIGQTVADVRAVMIKGPSGILRLSPPWFQPVYEPSLRLITWPNGCVAHTYSGDEPDQLRGPEHSFAWCDEPAKWQRGEDCWSNMEMGLRRGPRPQWMATTTPRPIKLIKMLVADPKVFVTNGSMFDNEANLPPAFLDRMREKWSGTRLGRQEIEGMILEDNPGALWNRQMIEECRVVKAPQLKRVVVGVDPQVGEGENAAETGIVVAALGMDGHGYVLADATVQGSPGEWASAAVVAYHLHKADRIVAEENQGGKMVAHTIRMTDPKVAYKGVHASRGKQARAEPVAGLYERGMIHHVGTFPALEDQLCEWEQGSGLPSPDRLDSLVWSLTDLILDAKDRRGFAW